MTEPIIRTFTVASWGTISSSTLAGNHVANAIHECITRDDGKGHYWYVDTDSLDGTGVKVENSLVTGIVLKNTYTNFDGNSKTQKLTVRSASLNRRGLAFALHPDGESTIITSLTTTSTGLLTTTASMPGALSSFSGESIMSGGYYDVANSNDCSLRYYNLTSARIADGQAVTGWIIELPDAITIVLKQSTAANWLYGIHAGKIFIPNDYSDYANFIDGSGLLAGSPSFYNSTGKGHRWWFRSINNTVKCGNNNYSSSKVRTGENVWATPYIVNSGNQNTASSNINEYARMSSFEVRAGNKGIESSESVAQGIVGTTKYLRKGPAGTLNEVIDSQNASNNISWLRQYVSGTSTLMLHIWKRGVDPITAQ
jgi:hypothetical protein